MPADLFDLPPPGPPGFAYSADLISHDEEQIGRASCRERVS
jgi:hypothetical protein